MIHSTARATGRGIRFAASATRGILRPGVQGAAGSADYLRREAARFARCLNLSTEAEGSPRGAQLIVANHLGYLDAVAFATLGPMAFVSKAEVGSWPGFGLLARRAGTIFLDRNRRGAVEEAAEAMRARVAAGIPVAVFPEGTSSDGSSVLPFHPSLFEVAVREGWRVVPAAIAYELPDGGDPATDAAYWGTMSFLPHFLRVLSLPRIVARIRFGSVRVAEGDRKRFARQMHSAVEGLHETLVHGEFRHPAIRGGIEVPWAPHRAGV
jgi:1-acyl-sn-glycerol-3-phosphate acyltransferase